uniref:Uncharacterized protein n=1 Tax=Anguilla anguilla TaxID=7936 RepID=A0A0E9U9X3_ANGAN
MQQQCLTWDPNLQPLRVQSPVPIMLPCHLKVNPAPPFPSQSSDEYVRTWCVTLQRCTAR